MNALSYSITMISNPSFKKLSIAVTANDNRSRPWLEALKRQASVVADVPFDEIDHLTRYAAAALSFRTNRAEWWNTYQMHPLVERRRRRVLSRHLAPFRGQFDSLIMWGSWFHPGNESAGRRTPFFHYIDQSMALTPVLGEPDDGAVDRRAGNEIQRKIYVDSAGVLCMSNWAREQTLLAHPTIDPSKVHVVGWGPCGVDLSEERIDHDAREPIVLHVSNDFHRKGLDYLVETAAIVRQNIPDARFIVIGEDYGGMKTIPTAEGVTFTGRINDRKQLGDYFRRASLFFLPHRFDRSPHVLVEAMSAELPIVTSRQGGPVELTSGTGAGFAIPIGDVRGYAEAITALLENKEQRIAMGRRGREIMLTSYTWDAVARKTLELVSSVVLTQSGEPLPPLS